MKKYKISVIGLGYVGLANALMLARHHEVVGVDTDEVRVAMLARHESPLSDSDIKTELLVTNGLRVVAKLSEVIDSLDMALIATPTDYSEKDKYFDTSTVESVLSELAKKKSRPSCRNKVYSTCGLYRAYA